MFFGPKVNNADPCCGSNDIELLQVHTQTPTTVSFCYTVSSQNFCTSIFSLIFWSIKFCRSNLNAQFKLYKMRIALQGKNWISLKLSPLVVFLLLKPFLLRWSIFRLYLLFPLTSSMFVVKEEYGFYT